MSAITNSGVQIAVPGSAPTVAITTTAGSLTAGAYTYKVTFVTGYGETLPSTASGSVTSLGNDSIALTAIPTSSDGNVTARKLYRTIAGGATYLLVATIANNTTTTYNDGLADASLGVAAPTTHTADSLQTVKGNVKFGKPQQVAFVDNITAAAGGGQANATPLTGEVNFITVSATSGDSCLLPVASSNLVGLKIIVRNNGAASSNIFPTTGQTIDGGSANTAVAVANSTTKTFVMVSSTAWKSY